MGKVAIIGAGASGIISALRLSEFNEVILIDGNDRCGRKILLTGNGKCNYWNKNIISDNYYTDNKDILNKILTEENIHKTYKFLESLGIYPRVKNDMFYPYSNQAVSIREIFEKEIKRKSIIFKTNFKVHKIEKNDNVFNIYSLNGDEIIADMVVLATGSKAYSKTGSDGSGYTLASSFGHTINDVYPALVPLVSNEKFLKDIENVRCDSKISLFIDGNNIKEEIGEIQFTKNGISGICTFNISSPVSKALKNNKKVEIVLDLMPYIDDVYNWLNKRNSYLKNKTIEEQLESIFNYKLMFVLFNRALLDKNSVWDNLTEEEKQRLCYQIKNFKLSIIETEDFDRGQVCTGGVPLSEIDPTNMKSKIVPNLYIIGELLDVDGLCGGFNLAFAFLTGYLTGSENDD